MNPARFEYNDLKQRTKLHTYRTETSTEWTNSVFPAASFLAAGDVTTWTYQAGTGLLASKTDASNRTTSYEYNAAGNISKRTDARSIITTYTYNPLNLLSTVSYSDGLTTGLTYAYDRSGRKTSVTDAAGIRTFGYYDSATDPTDTGDLLNKSGRLKTERTGPEQKTSGVDP